jgi:acetyltransferase-like isoleucine patch superfamily enzyme
MRILMRIARSPLTIARILMDSVWVPVWLRMNGVEFGRSCRFAGRPILTIAPGARIRLGSNVLINSTPGSNEAGLPHPTILAAVSTNSSIEIGDGTGISGASIVARSSVKIGNRVLVGAGACIWDNDFHPIDPQIRLEHQTRDALSKPITIEDDVFIGARAIVLKGVRIGRGAVIGAGSVVTKSVSAGDVVAGNPARVVSSVVQLKKQVASV